MRPPSVDTKSASDLHVRSGRWRARTADHLLVGTPETNHGGRLRTVSAGPGGRPNCNGLRRRTADARKTRDGLAAQAWLRTRNDSGEPCRHAVIRGVRGGAALYPIRARVSDSDGDLATYLAGDQLLHRDGRLIECVGAVDARRDGPGLDIRGESFQIGVVLFRDEQREPLSHER
jgi:hypothetical protein